MIYIYRLISDKKNKYTTSQFTLTAENDKALLRRIREQYSVPETNVEILERIKEEDIEI